MSPFYPHLTTETPSRHAGARSSITASERYIHARVRLQLTCLETLAAARILVRQLDVDVGERVTASFKLAG